MATMEMGSSYVGTPAGGSVFAVLALVAALNSNKRND
jgi:hypothetical protein